MVRHLVITVLSAAVLTGSVGVRAQSPEAGAQSEQTTVSGCLRAAANDGEFVLVNDEQVTYQVRAEAELDLPAHLNHRVELTGTEEKTDRATIFQSECTEDGRDVMRALASVLAPSEHKARRSRFFPLLP